MSTESHEHASFSRAEVEAAKLQVAVLEKLGRDVDPRLRQLALATAAASSSAESSRLPDVEPQPERRAVDLLAYKPPNPGKKWVAGARARMAKLLEMAAGGPVTTVEINVTEKQLVIDEILKRSRTAAQSRAQTSKRDEVVPRKS